MSWSKTYKSIGLPIEQNIKSTFPRRAMTLSEIVNYTKHNGTLTILSTYAKTSMFDLEMYCIVNRVWSCDKNGRISNEYGGNYGEYWEITYGAKKV